MLRLISGEKRNPEKNKVWLHLGFHDHQSRSDGEHGVAEFFLEFFVADLESFLVGSFGCFEEFG